MADWKKIKTEYITTETSYRKLAQKYGLDQATIARRAKKEGWVSNRQQNASKTQAKIIDKISDKTADKMARIEGITDKLLTKLDQAVNELDLVIVTRKIKTDNGTTEETTEYREAREGGIVDRSGLRQITAALKDLKEIQMLKSELDRREQEARIAYLQRQAAADSDDDDETGVVLLPPVKGG